jgi:hypothetical protein
MQIAQCPSCGEMSLTILTPRNADCSHCGAKFRDGLRICPACSSTNALENETCQGCGESLTVFSTVLSRQKAGSTSQRLEQLRNQAEKIKEQVNRESEVRMSQFQDIDRRRLEGERMEEITQQERDRILIRNVMIGSGIFLAIIAIIGLIVLL